MSVDEGAAKAYYDVRHHFDALHDESDRGCMVIGAAMLHDAIAELLAAVFIDPAVVKELIENAMGPIGTFSAQTRVAYGHGGDAGAPELPSSSRATL